MFTPKDLYERITALRQQEGLSASAAAEKLARKLSPDAEQIWSDCGAWFLAQVEQQYFRSGSAPRHFGPVAHRVSAAGTPWPLRTTWSWDAEFSIPHVGRKRLADITGADWQAAANVHRRTGETLVARARVEAKLARLVGKDETTLQAFQRDQGELKAAMKQLVDEVPSDRRVGVS